MYVHTYKHASYNTHICMYGPFALNYTFFVRKYLKFYSTETLAVATYNTLCFERCYLKLYFMY